MAKVTVLGAGAWGTAFGQVLADAGNDVTMWAVEQEIVDDINQNHSNFYRLPVVERLPDSMTATGDRELAVVDAQVIFVAISAQFAGEALTGFRGLIPDSAIVVSLMKGIEQESGLRMDEVVSQALDLPMRQFAAISGPNLSAQVAMRQPAAIVVASEDIEVANNVATICETSYLKPYVSNDVIGLELCGSLKNVVALAVGMAHGAGMGENTAAMIVTRGLVEMKRLGIAAGAQPETFDGLAGMGDLVATCSSSLSRNYTFGFNLGKGMSLVEACSVSNGVAEGVPTTTAVLTLAKQYEVSMPLASAVDHVIHDEYTFSQMMGELFGSQITHE